MVLDDCPEVVAIDQNVHFDDPVERFCLPGLWSLHLYRYEAELAVGETVFPIREGFVGVTPPGAETEYRYAAKASPHLYVHFRLGEGGATWPVRAMQDAGERFEEVFADLSEVVAGRSPSRARVNARVWDVLWRVHELGAGVARGGPRHPSVRKAVDLIERHLHEPLSVKELAAAGRVSYGYLSKLFEAEMGCSVVGFIRRRRIERALHLLVHTTLPVKTVAAWVGIGDLQYFNKLIHGETGASPREVRRRGE